MTSWSPSFGQSPYSEYQKAKILSDKDEKQKAFDVLHESAANLSKYPEKMTLQQANHFFELYERLTYGLGKMATIDSVYLKGIDYGELIENDTLSCKLINLRGNLWRIKNQWRKAIEILKPGLEKSCSTYDYIQIHAILGKCYNQINFDSIQYYTMKVLPLAEQTKDTANLMLLYNNLVNYYKKSNRKAQAFEYEKKSLEYEAQYPIMQVASHLSIAVLLTSMKHLSLAEEYIQNAESLMANKNDKRTMAQINVCKSRLEYLRKDYGKAQAYIQESLDFFVEKNYTNQIASALSSKANYALAKGDYSLYTKSNTRT